MNTNFWSSAAVNGLLLAFITILVVLLQTVFPEMGTAGSIGLWFIKFVTTIGALYYFMKGFGENQDSFPYGSAFRYGFAVSLCSSIILSAYLFFHYAVIFPESTEAMTEMLQTQMAQIGAADIDQSQLDWILNNLPKFLSVFYLFYYTILGLIISAILASFTKREEPVFASEE